MSHILQCPTCSQRFQVLADQAGTQASCPHCQNVIGIPAVLDTTQAEEPARQKSSDPPLVAECSECSGKIGCTESMIGRDVACPHCGKTTQVTPNAARTKGKREKKKERALPTTPVKPRKRNPSPASTEPSSNPAFNDSVGPPNQAEKPRSRSRWKDAHSNDPDLYAPGHAHDSNEDTIISEGALAAGSDGATKPGGAMPQGTSQILDESKPVWTKRNVDHLLPPRFDVLDPDELHFKIADDEHKVVLPDGKGGLQQVDNRMIRVRIGGEEVHLKTSTDEEKARRRLISNLTTISMLMLILVIVFFLLRKYM